MLRIVCVVGFDFFGIVIEIVKLMFFDEGLIYEKFDMFDIDGNFDLLLKMMFDGVDCILLIDLFEYVLDVKKLIDCLVVFVKCFIIKLLIELVVFDNYVLFKEYLSLIYSNGYLCEFDVNLVYYFVR